MKIVVVWGVELYSLVRGYLWFTGSCCLYTYRVWTLVHTLYICLEDSNMHNDNFIPQLEYIFMYKYSDPDLATGAWVLSSNRTQTRVVIGLLTGHNTLRRHLHIMGLCNYPICRKCGTEEETSVHILCECGALASLRHAYLGSFFLYPEDIRELDMGGHL
jgi:hypothetical protein